ncbi:hypothetical protein GCM10020000_12150 [Streptomyces olivoverticillatus]
MRPDDARGPRAARIRTDALRRDAERVLDPAEFLAELAEDGFGYAPLFSGVAGAYLLPGKRLVLEVAAPELQRDHTRRNTSLEPAVLAAVTQGIQLTARLAGTRDRARTALRRIDEVRLHGPSPAGRVAYVVFDLAADGAGLTGHIRLADRTGEVVGELTGVRCGDGDHADDDRGAPRKEAKLKRTQHDTLSFAVGELREMAAGLLKFDAEELDVHTTFDAFGFDSISLVAFAKLVRERLGADLSPAVFFDTNTFDALGRAPRHGLRGARPGRSRPLAPGRADGADPEHGPGAEPRSASNPRRRRPVRRCRSP